MIETPRLELIPFEEAHFQAIMHKDLFELGVLLDVKTPDKWTTFPDMDDALPFFYDNFILNGVTWGSFFTTHKIDKVLLGTCGFKGSPDTEGMVEIGYEIEKSYRNQGLATEVAQGLIDYACKCVDVKKIWAHTLASENPSVNVLMKLGFQKIGNFHEPSDGNLWRWEKLKS
jgi:[ribosomal protein S5]-alanine N-acetyltransferase